MLEPTALIMQQYLLWRMQSSSWKEIVKLRSMLAYQVARDPHGNEVAKTELVPPGDVWLRLLMSMLVNGIFMRVLILCYPIFVRATPEEDGEFELVKEGLAITLVVQLDDLSRTTIFTCITEKKNLPDVITEPAVVGEKAFRGLQRLSNQLFQRDAEDEEDEVEVFGAHSSSKERSPRRRASNEAKIGATQSLGFDVGLLISGPVEASLDSTSQSSKLLPAGVSKSSSYLDSTLSSKLQPAGFSKSSLVARGDSEATRKMKEAAAAKIQASLRARAAHRTSGGGDVAKQAGLATGEDSVEAVPEAMVVTGTDSMAADFSFDVTSFDVPQAWAAPVQAPMARGTAVMEPGPPKALAGMHPRPSSTTVADEQHEASSVIVLELPARASLSQDDQPSGILHHG